MRHKTFLGFDRRAMIGIAICLFLAFVIALDQFMRFGYWFQAADFHHEDMIMFFMMTAFVSFVFAIYVKNRR